MLGFGTRTLEQALGPLVALRCTECCDDRMHDYLVTRQWLTVFYLPVFPRSAARHSMVCPTCDTRIVIDDRYRSLIYAMLATTGSWGDGRISDEDHLAMSRDFIHTTIGSSA